MFKKMKEMLKDESADVLSLLRVAILGCISWSLGSSYFCLFPPGWLLGCGIPGAIMMLWCNVLTGGLLEEGTQELLSSMGK